MLKRFRPKHRSLLGVDISPTSVKVIELSTRENRPCIEAYGYESLPPSVIETNTIKDLDTLTSCIKKLISRVDSLSKFTALAVPDSTVISKTIQFIAGLNSLELEELVLIEADKYFAYPASEINTDFAILGCSDKSTNLLDILLIASKKEHVNRRVDAVVRAGLEAKIVDVESYAVERIGALLIKELPNHGCDKTVAVINISSLFVHVFILDSGKIVYTQEETFGAKHFPDSIVQESKLEVLQPYVEMTLLHVKRSLQFFFSTSHYDFIDHIFLAGELARLTNLASLIQQEMAIPTSVANLLKHMDVAKHLCRATFAKLAPSFLIACGLALRQLHD